MLEGWTFAKAAKLVGIKGFIGIGLAVALAFVMWRADGLSEKLEAKRDELSAERASHAVTRQSVADLTESLERFVGAGKAARVAQLAAMEAQADDSAVLQRQIATIRAEMATFAPDGRCVTPGSILNAEGL